MIYIVIPTTPERRHRCDQLVKSIQENTHDIPYTICIYENNDGGWVPAVYNALQGIDDYVWLLGSDCIVENNAVKILWETLEKYPEGFMVLEPYNELHGDTLCQHPFGHARMIRRYLDKRFTHWYSDNYFTLLAKKDGRLLYVPEAKIQHNHFVNGKAEVDETYKTIFNPETVEKDRLLFEKLTNEQTS